MWGKVLKDLKRVFEKHPKNNDARSSKGSTCAGEPFNLVVALRHPKRIIKYKKCPLFSCASSNSSEFFF